MCNFIGWDTCISNCSSWGNYSTTAGKSYTGYHASDVASNWVSENNVAKNALGTNRWVFPTGKFVTVDNKTTMKKNIFDVAGNVWEYTTEVPMFSSSNRVVRGGSANNFGETAMASCRTGSEIADLNTGWFCGFRIVLYVK